MLGIYSEVMLICSACGESTAVEDGRCGGCLYPALRADREAEETMVEILVDYLRIPLSEAFSVVGRN